MLTSRDIGIMKRFRSSSKFTGNIFYFLRDSIFDVIYPNWDSHNPIYFILLTRFVGVKDFVLRFFLFDFHLFLTFSSAEGRNLLTVLLLGKSPCHNYYIFFMLFKTFATFIDILVNKTIIPILKRVYSNCLW